MLLDTGIILRLNFTLSHRHSVMLLAEYAEAKEYKVAVSKHIPFITDFMVWLKNNGYTSFTQESVDSYLINLYSVKTKSYADVIRSYIRSFCTFLNEKGYIKKISFSETHRGIDRDPDRLCKVYNYYKYLGIPKEAQLSEIKKAYHSKVMSAHPDFNQNDSVSTNRMVALNKMYSILKNDTSRLAYDVTMGFKSYEEDMDSIEGIVWQDKKDYLVWV